MFYGINKKEFKTSELKNVEKLKKIQGLFKDLK